MKATVWYDTKEVRVDDVRDPNPRRRVDSTCSKNEEVCINA